MKFKIGDKVIFKHYPDDWRKYKVTDIVETEKGTWYELNNGWCDYGIHGGYENELELLTEGR